MNLFYRDLTSVIDVDAFRGGLAMQAATVEGVPRIIGIREIRSRYPCHLSVIEYDACWLQLLAAEDRRISNRAAIHVAFGILERLTVGYCYGAAFADADAAGGDAVVGAGPAEGEGGAAVDAGGVGVGAGGGELSAEDAVTSEVNLASPPNLMLRGAKYKIR